MVSEDDAANDLLMMRNHAKNNDNKKERSEVVEPSNHPFIREGSDVSHALD